ncbi:MAG: hypothetical protein ACU0CO_05140 [Shimia sp.]
MAGQTNTKILTVSYGTFSCTLEGFDDSFDTMKAIAEYFRDLAAEDRFFGAEPPQPDVQHLAMIAAREMNASVRAEATGQDVVLRPNDGAPRDGVVRPDTVTAEAPAPDPAPDPAAQPDAPPRAALSGDDRITPTPRVADDRGVSDESEDEASATIPPADADSKAGSESSDDDAPTPVAMPPAGRNRAERAAPADDSLAAKLQRIQAVVGADPRRATPVEAEYTEDEHAEEPDRGRDRASPAAKIAAAAVTAAVATGVAREALSDGNEAPRAGERAHGEPDEEPTEREAGAAPERVEEDTAAERPRPPRVLKMKRADYESAVAGGTLTPTVPGNGTQDGTPDMGPSSLSAEDEEDLARELAALAGDDPSDAPQADGEADAGADTVTPLDPDPAPEDVAADEADAPDRAPARAEDRREEAPAADAAPRRVERADRRGRAVLEDRIDPRGDDAAVDRLMAETEEKLSEPASRTRRQAFTHLKAAVAAKEADRAVAGIPEAEANPEREYRKDLAQVVRPRRPAGRTPEAPATSRRPDAAPLKLVAAQRVDAARSADPVQPRRVAVRPARPAEAASGASGASGASDAPEATAATVPGFDRFAADAGAQTLGEMLEAAAAFTTEVEGNAVFSRPHVMKMVQRAMPGGSFVREDGLRAFGTLLRKGRLEKVRGGQFRVTPETHYLADATAHAKAS